MKNLREGHWEWDSVPGLMGCLYLENITNERLREDYFRAERRGAIKFESNELGTLVLRPYWVENKPKENLGANTRGGDGK